MMKHVGRMTASWGALVCALGLAVPSLGIAAESDRGEGPWLGVYTQRLTTNLREGLDYRGDGVLVNRVVADSPADRGGIEKGDVIVSVNTRTARTPEELATIVRGARPGQTVRVLVVRDGQRKSLDVKLGSRMDAESRDEMFRGDTDEPQAPEPPEGPEVHELPAPPDVHDVPEPPDAPHARRGERMFDLPEGNVFLRGMGRGRLGVRIEDLSSDLGGYFGVKDGKGALVVEVLKGTPAERAGLKAGDVIVAVGAKSVADASDLVEALAGADDKVSLRIVRKGASRTIETELEQGPRTTYRFRNRGPLGMREGTSPKRIRIETPNGAPSKDLRNDELRQELRELREELRNLRQRLDQMDRN